jgi:hypothetical protein
MKKIFIFIIFNILILPIINSHAKNTASLYGIDINVPANFTPLKTNTKRFMVWDRMSYGANEIEAKTAIDQAFRDIKFTNDNELMFLGNENFVKLFNKQKDFESYHMWETHFLTETVYVCGDKKTTQSQIKCMLDNMGGNLSFTFMVSDQKVEVLENEMRAFLNYNKNDLKKYLKESLNLSPLPNLKKKLKKFSIIYDDDENIALLVDLKFKAGPITTTNRSVISFKDDRLIMFQMNCMVKSYCELGKSLFPQIVQPIIKLSSNQTISIKNGSVSNKDLEKFIGVIKTGYRIRSMSKLLFLLL